MPRIRQLQDALEIIAAVQRDIRRVSAVLHEPFPMRQWDMELQRAASSIAAVPYVADNE